MKKYQRDGQGRAIKFLKTPRMRFLRNKSRLYKTFVDSGNELKAQNLWRLAQEVNKKTKARRRSTQ